MPRPPRAKHRNVPGEQESRTDREGAIMAEGKGQAFLDKFAEVSARVGNQVQIGRAHV